MRIAQEAVRIVPVVAIGGPKNAALSTPVRPRAILRSKSFPSQVLQGVRDEFGELPALESPFLLYTKDVVYHYRELTV